MDPKEAEDMNITDKGKWLDFVFLLEDVRSIKLTSDDEGEMTCGCTTLFMKNDDHLIIDTPFEEFEHKFLAYHGVESDDSPNF